MKRKPKTIEDEQLYLSGRFYSRATWELILQEYHEDSEKLQAAIHKHGLPPARGGESVVNVVLRELERLLEAQS